MSTFSIAEVPCPVCETRTTTKVAESANAGRHPAFRASILDGTFMRFVCSGCGEPVVIERELLYTDLPRGQLIAVFPREQRGDGSTLEAGIRVAFDDLRTEPGLEGAAVRLERMVFGYAELREKLVIDEARLDDRVVEGLKVLVLAGMPGPGLLLVEVSRDMLLFEPLGQPGGRLGVPRSAYDALATAPGRIFGLIGAGDASLWVSAVRPLVGGLGAPAAGAGR